MARPLASVAPGSRARLLAAATQEFAANGLAGASVDRIARRARLNKAMVYYHFQNKTALYRETIRANFEAVGARVERARLAELPPPEKLAAFIEGFVGEALDRPEFPRMVMREMTESGRHLDLRTARAWLAVPEAFFEILREGVARGVFRNVHPLVAFLTIIGPTVLLLASGPARARVGRLTGRSLPDLEPTELIAQVLGVAVATLGRASPTIAKGRGRTRRTGRKG
jgi:AcrR family transcriptional regulator